MTSLVEAREKIKLTKLADLISRYQIMCSCLNEKVTAIYIYNLSRFSLWLFNLHFTKRTTLTNSVYC